jgi:bacteriocin-like protein
MELKELNHEELTAIYGGSEASDSLMYLLGAICKGFYCWVQSGQDGSGGYAYGKIGY